MWRQCGCLICKYIITCFTFTTLASQLLALCYQNEIDTKWHDKDDRHTTPLTDISWSPRFKLPWRSATPPGIIRDMYIGEFCSLPPITLNPRPSAVLGSSTTLGWAWPSLAANAATVAWHDSNTCIFISFIIIWSLLNEPVFNLTRPTTVHCLFTAQLLLVMIVRRLLLALSMMHQNDLLLLIIDSANSRRRTIITSNSWAVNRQCTVVLQC